MPITTAAARRRVQLDLRTSDQIAASAAAKGTAFQTTEYRQGTSASPLEVVLVGVSLEQSDKEIEEFSRQKFPSTRSTKRILRYPSRQPTSFVNIRFTDAAEAAQALKDGLDVGGITYTAEPPRARKRRPTLVTRCFNCQSLESHTSRTCPNKTKCPRCAESHAEKDCPTPDQHRCANCNGPHTAFSSACPAWEHKTTKAARDTVSANQNDVRDLRSDAKRVFQVVEGNNRYLRTHHELLKGLLTILKNQAAELVELRRLVTPPTETLREDDDSQPHDTSYNTTTDLVGDVVLDSSSEEDVPAPPSEEDDLPSIQNEEPRTFTEKDEPQPRHGKIDFAAFAALMTQRLRETQHKENKEED